MKKTLISAAACLGLAACATNGTNGDSSTGMAMNDAEPAFHAPIDYIPTALGDYRWTITTNSPSAQDYFTQGIQLRWAYNVNESARSMAEAPADPLGPGR